MQVAAKNVAFDLLAIALLGACQFGLLIALLNYGLQHLGAAQAALIFSLFPLLTLALAAASLAALGLIAADLWLATRPAIAQEM